MMRVSHICAAGIAAIGVGLAIPTVGHAALPSGQGCIGHEISDCLAHIRSFVTLPQSDQEILASAKKKIIPKEGGFKQTEEIQINGTWPNHTPFFAVVTVGEAKNVVLINSHVAPDFGAVHSKNDLDSAMLEENARIAFGADCPETTRAALDDLVLFKAIPSFKETANRSAPNFRIVTRQTTYLPFCGGMVFLGHIVTEVPNTPGSASGGKSALSGLFFMQLEMTPLRPGQVRLGLSFQDQAAEGSTPAGVKVVMVAPNSVAERSGIQLDDVVTSYDGQAIVKKADLLQAVAATKPGSQIDVTLYRAGVLQTISLHY